MSNTTPNEHTQGLTSRWGVGLLVGASALALGCGTPLVPTELDGSEDNGAPASSTTTGPAMPMNSTAVATTTTGASGTEGVDDGSASEVGSFVDDPDLGADFECDLLTQNCPAGFKCLPWSDDGGGGWTATRCSPIADNPGSVGDPCMVVEAVNSGVDDCDVGLQCWFVDDRTLQGECVAMCTGNYSWLICEDPGAFCTVSGDGLIALCLPLCDPLTQDCPEGQGCYAIQEAFGCAPDASGEMGASGEPCRFINGCDPGQICLWAGAAPGCGGGSSGCCSSICDLDGRNPPCPPGEECVAWQEEPYVHPSLEDVGVCVLPQ